MGNIKTAKWQPPGGVDVASTWPAPPKWKTPVQLPLKPPAAAWPSAVPPPTSKTNTQSKCSPGVHPRAHRFFPPQFPHMYASPRFRDAVGRQRKETCLFLQRPTTTLSYMNPVPKPVFSSPSLRRIRHTDIIAHNRSFGFFCKRLKLQLNFWVTMEALQCRNVVVGAMAAKAAAGEVQGRAVRIEMARNGAQGVGYVNHSSLSPSRDWRVYTSKMGPSGGHQGEDSASSGLHATVEKAENTKNSSQRFGSSEAYCDEGSSFVAVESVLENEGGKSVEDYKLRAHIFAESAVFFTALKNRNNGVSK